MAPTTLDAADVRRLEERATTCRRLRSMRLVGQYPAAGSVLETSRVMSDGTPAIGAAS